MSIWTIIEETWRQMQVWQQVLATVVFVIWLCARARRKTKVVEDAELAVRRAEEILVGQIRLYDMTNLCLRQLDEAIRRDDSYWVRQRGLCIKLPSDNAQTHSALREDSRGN